jgi:hypothetical protein
MKSTDGSDDWRVLCELASKEQDPEKLVELVVKINQALEGCHLWSHSYRPEVNIETVVPAKGNTSSDLRLDSYGMTSQCFLRPRYDC